jgi:thiamine-phosphate pyrophosphorylase
LVADTLARVQLARLAQSFGRRCHPRLPPLVFFTDDARLPDPLPAIRALPPGSMVVVRHRNPAQRRKLAEAVAPIARARGLNWIIAGDPVLAGEMRAHGVHFAESNIAAAARWRVKRPRWLITCAAHSLSACARASRSGVNAIFLAPVFATQSHPGRSFLGPLRTRLIAQLADFPLYALGGIDSHSAKRLVGARLSGLAAIGALTVEESEHK